MSTLSCIETYINKEKNYYGSFLIEPLEIIQGYNSWQQFETNFTFGSNGSLQLLVYELMI